MRSLNAVLAFILALNMSGCSWFGDDEEGSKDITKHDENKDKNKDDEDKKTDKVYETGNDDVIQNMRHSQFFLSFYLFN